MEREELEREIDQNAARLTSSLGSGMEFQSSLERGGVEFEKLRPYVAGQDPARNIDWKATAKGQGVFVREYTTDQSLELFVALDTSGSMDYGTDEWKKNEYAAIIMGSLLKAALNAQVPVGSGFSDPEDGLSSVISPSNSPGTYRRFLENVLERDHGGEFDASRLLNTAVEQLRAETVLVMISDFLQVGDWSDELLTASQKFTGVLCLAVRDPVEEDLPEMSKKVRLQDPESGNIITVTPEKVKDEYVERMKEREEELESTVTQSGAVYKKVRTDESFVKPLVQFIHSF